MTFVRLMDPLDFWIRSDLFSFVLSVLFPIVILAGCLIILKEILS